MSSDYKGLFEYDFATGDTRKVIDADVCDYHADTENQTLFYFVQGTGLYAYDMTQGSNTLITEKICIFLTTAQAEPQKQKHESKDIVMCWIPKGIRLPKFSVTVSFILATQTICLKKTEIIWNI